MRGAKELPAGIGAAPRTTTGRRVVEIGIGALVVAAAAQVAVPVPLSPVPMTLQPLAVLVVGALLGAAGGAAALVTYLMLGSIGFPVFAGGSAGAIHLMGPTGGYLLAFVPAAGLMGRLAPPGVGLLRLLLAGALAMAVIHIGGTAQLALLGGDVSAAFRLGFVPFFTGDLMKVGLAAAVILGVRSLRRPAP